mmetsp:Transcript_18164/g.52450  ORF Transcript_18164/g.52450 Transcript_18164/m.52450 type:complete len:279 (-) Transcript_18164:354-1190(-)
MSQEPVSPRGSGLRGVIGSLRRLRCGRHVGWPQGRAGRVVRRLLQRMLLCAVRGPRRRLSSQPSVRSAGVAQKRRILIFAPVLLFGVVLRGGSPPLCRAVRQDDIGVAARNGNLPCEGLVGVVAGPGRPTLCYSPPKVCVGGSVAAAREEDHRESLTDEFLYTMPTPPIENAECPPNVDGLHALHGQELDGQGCIVVGEVAQLPAIELAERTDQRRAEVEPIAVLLRRVRKVQVDTGEGKGQQLAPTLPLRTAIPDPPAHQQHDLRVSLRQLRLDASA